MPLRTLLATALAVIALAAACSSDDTDAPSAAGAAEVATSAADTGDADDAVADSEAADDQAGDELAEDELAEDEATIADPPPLGEQIGEVTVVGDPLDVMPPQTAVTEPANDPAIGQRAPEISGTSFSGSPVEILADGTPRVVMFVAHWCPHCQREIPAVKELIDAGAVPEGLELVVVSTAVRDDQDNFPPQTWLEDVGWPGPVIRDSGAFEAYLAYGAGGFPFSVYLNADHEVVTRSAGELPAEILQQLWLATVDG